ncbi:hypothetical protein E2C01_078356 [Portunus trituberculatus]|uniref:Uncharacterized protein n=1 Tax=Portunus trituberculatus TaxID=210409 RepID=A0A5B7III7_PORTR|nr:hypothetical protein [Portunus trituberculatus]
MNGTKLLLLPSIPTLAVAPYAIWATTMKSNYLLTSSTRLRVRLHDESSWRWQHVMPCQSILVPN